MSDGDNRLTMAQQPTPESVASPPLASISPVRRILGRLGCFVGVSLWVIVLLIPGFLFLLAIEGEIAVWHGAGFPEPEAHPLLQVKLLMEIDTRGLNITASHISHETSTAACVQTNVNYVLWQGEGEPASYCDCYTRPDASASWALSETYPGACASPDQQRP